MHRQFSKWMTPALMLALAACGGQAAKQAEPPPPGPAAKPMHAAIGAGEGEVSIVAWPGYIERGETDPAYDWVTGFEKATGCKVTVKPANTSDEMVALMNDGGFDLVTASGDASNRLISGGKVQEVNISLVPSWDKVEGWLRDAPWHTVDGKHFGVPYQWGPNVLMYNTKVFASQPPDSWKVVFEEMTLPDGKSNKGRVQAYDGPIYIADAALYLKATKPDLGIQDVYELTEDQYKAALDVLRQQRKLVGKYWHDRHRAGGRLQERGRGGLLHLALPGQPAQVGQPAGGERLSQGGLDGLGGLDHDARRRAAPQLRLPVDGAHARPQVPG